MASRLDQVLSYVQRTPWAILPTQGEVIASILTRRASGERLTQREIRERIEDRRAEVEAHEVRAAEMSASNGGAVSVIPIVGTIVHRAGGMDDVSGMVSTQRLVRRVREAQGNASVRAILLDVDSPGGTVDGVMEAAAALREGGKPVVAVANTMAASAAYWLAAQADELIVTPSGEVGSIGVYTMHADMSKALAEEGVTVTVARAGKYKAERLPFAPLTDEARAEMDAEVADYYEHFIRDVAKGRGVAVSKVRNGFGEGRMARAEQAVTLGMADKVATLEETYARLAGNGRVRRRAASSESWSIGPLDLQPVEISVSNNPEAIAPAANADVPEDSKRALTVIDDLDIRERELAL